MSNFLGQRLWSLIPWPPTPLKVMMWFMDDHYSNYTLTKNLSRKKQESLVFTWVRFIELVPYSYKRILDSLAKALHQRIWRKLGKFPNLLENCTTKRNTTPAFRSRKRTTSEHVTSFLDNPPNWWRHSLDIPIADDVIPWITHKGV